MKIGILTFPRAINYGASLQAAALLRILREQGADVAVIDYHCEAIDSTSKVFDIKQLGNMRYVIAHLYNLPDALKRKKAFQDFWDSHYVFGSEDPEDYDMMVAGSDQVWNYNLTGSDWFYYLDFEKKNKKKAAYAASFGLSELDPAMAEKMRPLLEDFDCISVREPTAAKLVESICGNFPQVVLDPTLLLDREQWERLADAKLRQQGYIFVYTLFNSDSLWAFANELSRKTGLPIKTVSYSRFHKRDAEYSYTAGPAQWLSYMLGADYVVTNSFHGFAFSVNFEKQFFYELPPKTSGVGSRLADMAETYGLVDREISAVHGGTIDYNPIREKLNLNRKNSMEFIRCMLENT